MRERLSARVFNWKMYSIGDFLPPKMPAKIIAIMIKPITIPVGIRTFFDKITSLSNLSIYSIIIA